jgi:hypothetical protein
MGLTGSWKVQLINSLTEMDFGFLFVFLEVLRIAIDFKVSNSLLAVCKRKGAPLD